eukprot:CAMPEP_0202813108 /NCGR_PEP_ID=MMETSP1389-20130828/4596_1 /ASSEMBLY_ACC=CAM_ASM_000865 /TAXON_ID=302021 /ORGANISM="Rhodomonas sp., Strain CCMP768" /LENGTH=150 /DNA_ID=CAMNT_0049484653 /DNA_START=54 /DNA_END=506 /DNA_ORIENTATION=+
MMSSRFALRNTFASRVAKEGAALTSRTVATTQPRFLSTTQARTGKSLQEEAEAFNSMLRKWNPTAYQKVDKEIQRELEREEITSFAKKLRSWNPSAYSTVDAEHRQAAQRAAAAASFSPKKVKGVFWTDAHGRDHVHKFEQSKPADSAPA